MKCESAVRSQKPELTTVNGSEHTVRCLMAALLAASTLGAAVTQGAAPPFFTERVISSSALGARSVFAVDVDNDGDMDVLSASFNDDTIAWYENDGASPPGFTERIITISANGAGSVFAADVDGDGDMDVLSASRFDSKIAWYENDGASTPSFTEHVISTSADHAESVFAADVDGDGDVDVLSASFNDHKIAWYENDGASPPSFTERIISTSAVGAKSVFAADVDGDGDIDILSASERDDKIAWYESDGATPPSFTPHAITTSANGANSVFVSDMDGDGDIDVLSASRFDNKIAWYENVGNDGGIEPKLLFVERAISTNARSASSVFAADVDGDGDMDVLSASMLDDKVAWYESNGATPPVFIEHIISIAANGASSVFAADMNGDGDMDVLSASSVDNKIALHQLLAAHNQTTGGIAFRFSDAIAAAAAGETLRIDAPLFILDPVVNFNSKPLIIRSEAELTQPDIGLITLADSAVLAAAPGAEMSLAGVLITPASALAKLEALSLIFMPSSFVAIEAGATLLIDSISPADLGGSVQIDQGGAIILSSSGALGEQIAFVEHVISTNAISAQSVYAVDVDGDGDMDVLSQSNAHNGGNVAWYENTGANNASSTTNFLERQIAALPGRSVSAADLDGDGDVDVLSTDFASVVWHENRGQTGGASQPSFATHFFPPTDAYVSSVFAADVDSDGDIDVLSASAFDDKIAWHENDGSSPPNFIEHIISTVADAASSVFAIDMDGDGDTDALSASTGDNKIAWYENAGPNGGASPPSFATHIISTIADGARSVFAADMDKDGDIDVLSASSTHNSDDKIAWYESDGALPPIFTEHVISTNAIGPESVFAVDVDGDGNMDVLSASIGVDKISLFLSDGASPPSFTELIISTIANNPQSVFAADIDGDGDIDLLSASERDNKIAWYEQLDRPMTTLSPGSRLVVFGSLDNESRLSFDSAIVEVANGAGGTTPLTNRAPGVISGVGDLLADVSSSGEIRPGGVAGSLSGFLTIQGDYVQFIDDVALGRQSGDLFIDIAGLTPGSGHDAIAISGAANLAGGLFISLANSFTPQAGDRFTILTAGSIGASVFDAVFLPTLPSDLITGKPLVMRVEYNRNAAGVGDSVELVVGQACSADLNGDGEVSVFDLAELLTNWGLSNTPADLTGDGAVDVFDLAELLSSWGPCQ